MRGKALIALTLALCLAGTAAAAREAYGTFDSNSPTAAVVIDGETTAKGESFAGLLETAGAVTAAEISGVRIVGDGADNGIVIRKAAGGSVAIGGSKAVYDIDDDGIADFNSVIILDGPEENPDIEGAAAAGIFVDSGESHAVLTVDGVYIKTSGYRAPTVISRATDFSLVFRRSYLESEGAEKSFMPNFKLMVGSARATCLMNENTWFYNSIIRSRDWGAFSLDTTPYANIYMVNSYGESCAGGYGLYAVNGTTTNMYGSKMTAGQYGMFLMGSGAVLMDSLDAADETAMEYAADCDFTETVTPDGRSIAAGFINAAVVHVNSGVGAAGLKNPASLVIKGGILSTMEEDVRSSIDSDISFETYEDYLLAPIKDQGASWFYLRHCQGSAILSRSAGVDITLDKGSEIRAVNGVAVHSVIGYDSDAGNIYNDSSLKIAEKISHITVNINAPLDGDIVHEDYQRYMNINVNSDYTGSVTSGTIDTWNALWSDAALSAALDDGGYDESEFSVADNGDAIRGWMIREEADYPAVYGAVVKIAADGVWNVAGKSSMSSLTVAPGGKLELPEGYEIYVNCGKDYNYLNGEKLEALTPGQVYSMVVIAVDTGFSDVGQDDWFCEAVMGAKKLGLIDGMGDGSFAPNEYLTLAQTVKLASAMLEIRLNGVNTIENGDPWYENYVIYALNNGLIAEEFADWRAPATRSQAAYIFGNLLPAAGLMLDSTAKIVDVAEDAQYFEQISSLYSAKVLTGYEDGSFRGDGYIRRSEMAAMLIRMAELMD